MSTLHIRIQNQLKHYYNSSHPGYSQALLLLDSLKNLTEEKVQTPIENIPQACVYFYTFIRSSLLAEKDTRKLFSLSVLMLFLLKDDAKTRDRRLTGLVQMDEEIEKRIFELLLKRKEKLVQRVTLEVEVGLLFLAIMKTKSRESWQDFTKSKLRLDWLFKLATHNKKTLRKSSLAFLKQLLRSPNSFQFSLNSTRKIIFC
jgi:hypothetical protein